MTADVPVIERWLTRERVAQRYGVSASRVGKIATAEAWRTRTADRRHYFHPDDVAATETKRAAPRPAPLTSPGERLAANVTTYRLAIELARSAIRIGRYREALTYLDEAVQ